METKIQQEIRTNKEFIERDNLTLPTTFEEEMAEFALTYINKFKGNRKITFYPSFYEAELKKVYKELNRHFQEEKLEFEDNFVSNPYIPTNEISKKTFEILKSIIIEMSTSEYYEVLFKENQIPYSLRMPYYLDDFSYVYIGHEIIHLLKDTNVKEWKNLLRHADVLPMLYEFVQMKYKRQNTKRNIINQRMQTLLDMQSMVIKAKEIISNQKEFEIYKLRFYQYYISFYYTILLFQKYLKYPKTVLREFKNVLLQKKTTQELLEYFELYERLEIFDFKEGCEQLLKMVV